MTVLSSYVARALSLRVRLAQIQSTTHAFYPEETHSSIRRVFTPHHAPHTKRHFCGFCGTPLSYWSEESPEEADWVLVNLNSLKRESVDRLEDAGFLSDVADLKQGTDQQTNDHSQSRQVGKEGGREVSGTPWFEEMIQGSQLGRIKRRRGGGRSSDGKTIVEYEVTEFKSGDGDAVVSGTGKRKHGSLADEDDVEMRSG